MNPAPHDMAHIVQEHQALLRHFAGVQLRCSELLRRQAAEIERLQAQAIRQRAAILLRDTALAWAREDHVELQAAIPGLPRRATLSRHVEKLKHRVQELMHERLRWQRQAPPPEIAPPTLVDEAELAALEQSLVTADLVICQTGCVSHGAYWRVQDHCRRTGKACVLVEQPDALRIVRIHASDLNGEAEKAAPPLA
ncbi:DUF2325 domain-containing protein [Xylophilus rhododendri]|uniref:DUF2325 domain-containing protein n=1 Tax=Xylophilus rhododendri TaxID=2697032 RepID=A0A857J0K5_9BURK|nr:DUF2325 domain-containing protein [Xylophilus rhododendri]QHI96719.1 DUF2325 domain-containing protein [Xylophilus rhododendri]